MLQSVAVSLSELGNYIFPSVFVNLQYVAVCCSVFVGALQLHFFRNVRASTVCCSMLQYVAVSLSALGNCSSSLVYVNLSMLQYVAKCVAVSLSALGNCSSS